MHTGHSDKPPAHASPSNNFKQSATPAGASRGIRYNLFLVESRSYDNYDMIADDDDDAPDDDITHMQFPWDIKNPTVFHQWSCAMTFQSFDDPAPTVAPVQLRHLVICTWTQQCIATSPQV
jgi:hypothetical protein